MIVERGTHHQLLAQGGLYASMWNRQREAQMARDILAEVEADEGRPQSQPARKWRSFFLPRRMPPNDARSDAQCPSSIPSARSSRRSIRRAIPSSAALRSRAIVLFWLWPPFGWLGTVVTLWCAYFFRDPPRVTPAREGVVVAPADGRISRIANAAAAEGT